MYNGVYFLFNKKFSSFALLHGKSNLGSNPYQTSPNYHATDHSSELVVQLRTLLSEQSDDAGRYDAKSCSVLFLSYYSYINFIWMYDMLSYITSDTWTSWCNTVEFLRGFQICFYPFSVYLLVRISTTIFSTCKLAILHHAFCNMASKVNLFIFCCFLSCFLFTYYNKKKNNEIGKRLHYPFSSLTSFGAPPVLYQ